MTELLLYNLACIFCVMGIELLLILVAITTINPDRTSQIQNVILGISLAYSMLGILAWIAYLYIRNGSLL